MNKVNEVNVVVVRVCGRRVLVGLPVHSPQTFTMCTTFTMFTR
ncbi:MAG: hypothetical protein PVH68_12630 [Armatimonadota bacterium]